MTQYLLQNEELEITVNSHGAELVSLKDRNTQSEYMWEGNPAVWGRTSPILFPFVGSLKNKTYTFEDSTFPMSQHGFARDMEFTLSHQNNTSLWFCLDSNENTLKQYPFPFHLEIGYELEGRSVKVLWKVTNPASQTMYFSIGGHPGFVCPFGKNEKQTDCYLEFKSAKQIVSSVVNTSTGLLTDEKKIYPLEDGILKITSDLFDQDALVLENHQTDMVSLLSFDKTPYLSVSFAAPLFGVWSMPHKGAPYICIEPWYGRCDHTDFNGSLEERTLGNTLEAGQTFQTFYNIQIYPTL